MELLCPAGNLPALKAAIDQGADAVYIGFKDDTNARHFAGLNFDEKKLARGVDYVHQHGRKLHVAINTFAHPDAQSRWQQAVDLAAEDYFNVNAVLSYLVRINLVARWTQLDEARGRAMLGRLLRELDGKELINNK